MYEVRCVYGMVASFWTSDEAHEYCDRENEVAGPGTYWVIKVSRRN